VSCRINAIMPGVTDIVSAVISCLGEEDAIGAVVASVKASQRSSLSMGPPEIGRSSNGGRRTGCHRTAAWLAGQRQRRRTRPQNPIACLQRQNARTNPRQFGAIRNEPGNLFLIQQAASDSAFPV
jgi:hypothetical protein